MKKYPDNTEIYALKKSRRNEIESLPPIERLKMAKSLQEMTRIVSSKRVQKPRDPNWSVAKGRKVPVKSKFDETKTAQLAGVLLQLRGGCMHYMKLIKLMYLVDRAALLRWGSPITFDNYVSMPHGPVLSSTLDLINEGPTFGRETPWHDLIERSTDPYSVKLKTKPNTDRLSEQEQELIKLVFEKYGHMNRYKLRDLLHEILPEWQDPKGSALPITHEDIKRHAKVPLKVDE